MDNSNGTIFDLDEYKGFKDRWNTRINELNRRASYYDGSVYKGNKALKVFMRALPQLVSQIKPIYLLLSRAVDVDAGIIPGGWLFPGELTEGEAPIDLIAARDLLFSWSNWDTDGVLYVHYGAQYGLTGLRIADLPENKVMLQPVDPTTFMLVNTKQYSGGVDLALLIEKRTDESGEPFEYAEAVTAESISTFKNGEPWGFDGREPVEPNNHGIVPFVEVQHMRTGKPMSEATYQKAIASMNEVNEMATDLAQVIKDNRDPQVVVAGAEPGELTWGRDQVWFLPDGADTKVIVPGINVDGVLKFIQDIKKEIKDSLPELSFNALKEKTQIATETLEIMLTELVLKIKRIRPNYDAGLIQAMKMAAEIASKVNVQGIEPLGDENMIFEKDRPVLPLDPMTEMNLRLKQIEVDAAEAMLRGPAVGDSAGEDGEE